MLFTHRCTECERTQLIFPSQANGVTTRQGRPAVAFTCWCGATQSRELAGAERELVDA